MDKEILRNRTIIIITIILCFTYAALNTAMKCIEYGYDIIKTEQVIQAFKIQEMIQRSVKGYKK